MSGTGCACGRRGWTCPTGSSTSPGPTGDRPPAAVLKSPAEPGAAADRAGGPVADALPPGPRGGGGAGGVYTRGVGPTPPRGAAVTSPPPDPARCPGTLGRRAFVRAGLGGLWSLGLTDLFRLRAAAGPAAPSSKSVIVLWLWGGPSHMDTFDLKPDAPAEYRGLFRPIPTAASGVRICELLPRLARVADRFALVRSLSHDSPGHVSSTHTVMTGYPGEPAEAPPFKPKYPDFWAVAARALGGRPGGMPPFVVLPRVMYHGAAYLGTDLGPLAVTADPSRPDFGVPGVGADEGVRPRLAGRASLLDQLDAARRALDGNGVPAGADPHRRQALDLLLGDRARAAFDLSREPDRVRDRYGRHPVGQRLLLARRLVEAGVRLVTVDFPCVPGQKAFSWDDHASVWNIFEQMKIRLPVLDQVASALVEDLYARGLDRDVLFVVMGEMSHTPKLSNFKGQPGREHWGRAMSVLLAGGGLRSGQAVGSTTARGEEPKDRPLTPNDLLATWYRFLGVPLDLHFPDRAGRPVAILPHGRPIAELF
jgi:Protein of unknown function (DUF1501)